MTPRPHTTEDDLARLGAEQAHVSEDQAREVVRSTVEHLGLRFDEIDGDPLGQCMPLSLDDVAVIDPATVSLEDEGAFGSSLLRRARNKR